ncbi:ATP-binding protein [Roseateles sp. BYS180W]|uniref:histidine kinase n=1 Tax=Roseateles rivi TaxID=3299028 RepID=A0ABW7FRP8_9BURK
MGSMVGNVLGAQPRLMPQPDAAPTQAVALTLSEAELATSLWTEEQLQRWWALLRHGGARALELPADLAPPDLAQQWQLVPLPDTQRLTRLAGASDRYQMRWYRLRLTLQEERWPSSMAVYVPRLVANAAAVMVRTDGQWHLVHDNQRHAREQWVRPLWVTMPAAIGGLSQQPEVELVLAVPVRMGQDFVLSRVSVGDVTALEDSYRARWALQIGLPQATALSLSIMGLFALTLWLRRRSDRANLVFTLASLAWLLCSLPYFVEAPHAATALAWFWWLAVASMAWVVFLTFAFVLEFASQRLSQVKRIMAVSVLVLTVAAMPVWQLPNGFWGLYAAIALQAMLGLGVLNWVAWGAMGSPPLKVFSVSLLTTMALGLHDLGMLDGWWGAEHVYLMPVGTLLVLLCFLYALRFRYFEALHFVALANQTLSQRLTEQEAQLQHKHELLLQAEREQALLRERQRLMQDMHDGLGSSLLSAMVAVEQGLMRHDQVVDVLRECVDDLRLVIDSLEPVSNDLVSLLATMRYRLGKRLQAGGLNLEWDVQDLPPLDWLEPPDALQVLRLMQEALTNTLKHARAGRVRVVTRDLGEQVEIRVEDDGCGFDSTQAQHGRGLRGLRRRAQMLGGAVDVQSRPGQGTVVRLLLPLHRAAALAGPAPDPVA